MDMVNNTVKKTALFDRHVALGGSMVEYAGYMMPVRYSAGVIAEHKAVRGAAGLFDVSHMGEFHLRCDECDDDVIDSDCANDFLQYLLCNDFTGMNGNTCRYSPMLNDGGGVVDDLIVYRHSCGSYMIVVNAANKDKDFAWIQSRLYSELDFVDVSDDYAEIALQGPKSREILGKLANAQDIPLKYYTFTADMLVAGVPCLVSRTGYTGEDGFEIFAPNADIGAVWDAILDVGKPYGVLPCGLGARDTLRLEAAMPLYGHELSDTITPLEAGLSMFVHMEKPDFIGRAALQKAGEPSRKRVGIRLLDKGIARDGATVYANGEEIGCVTSGTMLPWLEYAGAMALIDAQRAQIGVDVEVNVRGRMIPAQIVRLPFYKRNKKSL